MSVHTFRQRAILHRVCQRELERAEHDYYLVRTHTPRHPLAVCAVLASIILALCALVACMAPTAGGAL